MKYLIISALAILPFLLSLGQAKDLKIYKIVEKQNKRNERENYNAYDLNNHFNDFDEGNNVKVDVAYFDPDFNYDRSLTFSLGKSNRNRQKVEHGNFLKTLKYLVRNLRNQRDGRLKTLKKRPLKDDSSGEEFLDETRYQRPIIALLDKNDFYEGGKKDYHRRPLYRLPPPLLRTLDDDSGQQVDERTAPPPSRYIYDKDYE